MVFYFQVQDHIKNLVEEHFNSDLEVVMRDPILFGDFRMAMHEEETRVYEDIQDYEAAKALFQVWPGPTVPILGFGVWTCVWSSGSHTCNLFWLMAGQAEATQLKLDYRH
jgi:hypothetical protein